MNRRPRPYQGRALPTELPGHTSRWLSHMAQFAKWNVIRPSVFRHHGHKANWSGKRDSNPRPRAWKARALPTELFPQTKLVEREGFEPSKASPADLQSAPFGHSGTSPLLVKHRTIPCPALPTSERRSVIVSPPRQFFCMELAIGLEPTTC